MHAARDKATPPRNTNMKHRRSTQQLRHQPYQPARRPFRQRPGTTNLQDLFVAMAVQRRT